jgi:predicted O-methyltransferase YrrM
MTLLGGRFMDKKNLTATIFYTLRILDKVEPKDTYLVNYKWHRDKWGDEFFDQYCLGFFIGFTKNPKNILEIGSRTGLSLCQLLSGCKDFEGKRVVLFDLWDDGLSNPELIKKYLSHLAIDVEPEFYQGDSLVTVPEFKKTNTDKFDYILVDGGHDDATASVDLENVVDLVRKGGVIVFDDISATIESDGFNIKPTWERFKKRYFDEFKWNEDMAGKGTAWAIKI